MSKTYDFTDELAKASAEYNLDAPLAVVLGEAEGAANFLVHFWEPVLEDNEEGEEPRPGLSSVGGRLKRSVAGEIRQLAEASQAAHTEAVLAARPKKDLAQYQDGQFIFTELRAILEFHFDDGVVDEKDEQLAAIKAQHEDAPATAATLASKLVDFATLADKHRADLDGVSGFDAALIDQAFEKAKALRASATPAPAVSEKSSAYDRRNKHLNLLAARVKDVRRAARLTFRHHPEIAALATSAHARKQRADARRAALEKKEDEGKE